ncbi:transporter substrate-binding domain-containing protein [Undibacterium sp. LX40W]|uniref:Transporter substrate-binding domain-containing protein n=1 Tax=Undibacterium nitidum TaxID=2762298 RepID=A0A923KTD0_9BURK|nr:MULTISPECIES: transporter substrate-binding domain-containing protein [Undibacterium]MBC3881147.1 transporter substrate-binding domain-containing protein [Undibacterium nitidum]MBC3890120.1 transporter substrate-binding domain-containing protein [Undibacterium sp. LX40W]
MTVAGASLFFTQFASAQELQAYTEDWPPYNYQQEGVVTGILTDILREACAVEKIQCSTQLVPWARAYKTVQETTNTLIYGIAKTPARESQLIWVGPVLPRTTWIFARPEVQNKLHSMSDLSALRIGMIRGEASADELLNAGVAKEAIVLFNSNNDVIRTFKLGKIDVLVNTEIGMAVNQKNFQIPDDKVKRVMKFYDGGSIYFGLNLHSDPVLVERLQNAVDKLRREGRIQQIVQQYTKKF